MAAYASYTDVQSEFKALVLSSSSTPTQAAVTEFITQAENRINSRVGMKYVTPVDASDSPISTSILKMCSIWMVTQRVKSITRVKTGDEKTSQGGDTDLEKKALDIVEKIVSGDLELPDAVLSGSKDGVQSFVVDNSESQVFQKDSDQW